MDLLFAQKVIIVTVILENMARLLGEENIEDEDIADNGDLNDVVEDNALDTARLREQLVRNNKLRHASLDSLSLRADSLHIVTQIILESAVANLYSH